ncbi:MAG: ABC-F family ATP-binding cassette domain-containing protein [Burkholderiaceae bacterium]
MAPPILKLENIRLTFGGTPLLTGAGLSATPGDRICLVGRNGSGKSTLLRIAAGLVEPDSGERFMHPAVRARYLGQEIDFSGYATALAYVEASLGPADDRHAARYYLNALGLDGSEDPNRLSGGEARRVALAAVLAPDPGLLLLDEPTNHLDLPAIEWLENELAGLKSAIVVISHDRRFLERISRTTVWLDRGETRVLDRGFAEFEAWRDDMLEREDLERHKLDRKIAREDQWMHGGVTARRKRNVRRVAELAALRQKKRDARRVQGNVRLEASEAQASGKLIVEATDITKSFGAGPVVQAFSTRIGRGDRVGLVGPNGAGKTTLLKMLIGELAPDSGTIRHGANLEIAALDQRRDSLAPNATVAETLTGGRGDYVTVNGERRHVATYMKDFLFQPEQARSPVRVLSGGERARLLLARLLSLPSNVLVLDEPTNDLDLETLDLLEEMIAGYPGTVLLVSHDRDFLDRIVTSVIAAEGDGRWIEYAGGYTDMLMQRRGADLVKAPPKVAKAERAGESSAAAAPSAPAPKRKLSFKEKHALETLPALIDKLSAEIAALEVKAADATLYTRDPKAFEATTKRLAAAQQELAAAEHQWLELEMLREELAG